MEDCRFHHSRNMCMTGVVSHSEAGFLISISRVKHQKPSQKGTVPVPLMQGTTQPSGQGYHALMFSWFEGARIGSKTSAIPGPLGLKFHRKSMAARHIFRSPMDFHVLQSEISLVFISHWLVVDLPLWKMLVNGKKYPIFCGKKECSKPPTR